MSDVAAYYQHGRKGNCIFLPSKAVMVRKEDSNKDEAKPCPLCGSRLQLAFSIATQLTFTGSLKKIEAPPLLKHTTWTFFQCV